MGSGGVRLWGETLPAQMWGDVPCVAGPVLAVPARVAGGTEQSQPLPGAPALELLAGDGLSSIFELGVSGTQRWLLGTANWVSPFALVRLSWGALPFLPRLSCTPFLHPLPLTPHTCLAARSPPL